MDKKARLVLKIHGILLLCAGCSMTIQTVLGHSSGNGLLKFLYQNLFAAIGFFEAYLLAGFTGFLLLLFSGKYYTRRWHLISAGVHIILATTNIIFWEAYAIGNIVKTGYIATAVHLLLITIETMYFIRTRNLK